MFGTILVIVVLIPLVLEVVDKLLGTRGREAAKNKVENFWYRTADLEVVAQFRRAIGSRYTQMKALRQTFISTFLFCSLVWCCLFGALGALNAPHAYTQGLRGLAELNFNIRFQFVFVSRIDRGTEELGDCTPGESYEELKQATHIAAVRESVIKFLDENHNAAAARVSSAAVAASAIATLVIPLTLALFVSLNVTLWLLSKVTQSAIKTSAIVVFDLALALFMPPFISSFLLTCLAGSLNYFIGTVPDFSLFDHPTWLTITASTIGVKVSAVLGVQNVFLLFANALASVAGWLTWIALVVGTFVFAYNNAKMFLIEIKNFIFWSGPPIDPSQFFINFAIGIDLLFSLSYILPCIAIVTAHRSPIARNAFLNLVQWVAEHPNGPVIAVANLLTSVVDKFRGDKK